MQQQTVNTVFNIVKGDATNLRMKKHCDHFAVLQYVCISTVHLQWCNTFHSVCRLRVDLLLCSHQLLNK